MRADRLLSLLLLLQTRGRMTAADLAERLEVSERTIYRDLDALSAAGVPVYAQPGPEGGCMLREGYRTDLTGLTDAEVASLFAGAAGRVLSDLGLEVGLQRALLKLEAALPKARRVDAQRARTRLYVDPSAWFAQEERTSHLALLRDAVFADRRVRLVYRSDYGRETRRVVDPLGLVIKGGIWYLIAATDQGMRVFRASRLRSVGLLSEGIVRPPDFDLASFWTRWSRDFVTQIPQYLTTLRIPADMLVVLPQVFGARAREAIDAAGRPRKGALTITLSFDSLEAACSSLLGLAAAIEVVGPPELRRALRRRAEVVAAHYADK